MDNKILLQFLKKGLLQVDDRDDRVHNLADSVNDLAEHLDENPGVIPKYTLVGLDADIPADEPVLEEVETLVTKHWVALRSKFHDRPSTILRAVIAGALYQLGLADPKVARLVYLTASEYFRFLSPGQEREILETLLSELGDVAEENAAEEWGFEEEIPQMALRTFKVTELKFGQVELDKATLKSTLKSASLPSPSGHHAGHGNSEWNDKFAETASEGIVKLMAKAFEGFGQSLKPTALETPINTFFAEFKTSLTEVLNTSFQSMIAVERRSKLLWWKETLYSPFLKKGYRELEPAVLPVLMAYDLCDLLPLITPLSVNYLLRDTFRLLGDEYQKTTTIEALLDDLAAAQHRPLLKQLLEPESPVEGRMTLVEFLAQLLQNQVQKGEVFEKTGIAPDRTLTPADLSMLVLNELLTAKLIEA